MTWEVYGTTQRGALTAPPGFSYFETQTIDGPNTTKIYWYDETGARQDRTKASGGQDCNPPTATPSNTPTETSLPTATNTPEPTAPTRLCRRRRTRPRQTDTPEPTATDTPTSTATNTPRSHGHAHPYGQPYADGYLYSGLVPGRVSKQRRRAGSGGVVEYYYNGWKSLGTTDDAGQVSGQLAPRSYDLRVTYGEAPASRKKRR
jgi:hypothetical protein